MYEKKAVPKQLFLIFYIWKFLFIVEPFLIHLYDDLCCLCFHIMSKRHIPTGVPKQQNGVFMTFQLKGNRKETENKTIRFPIHLIEQIEQAISDSDQDITFSSLWFRRVSMHWLIWMSRQKKTLNFYLFKADLFPVRRRFSGCSLPFYLITSLIFFWTRFCPV